MVVVVFDVAGVWRTEVQIRKRLNWYDIYAKIYNVTGITMSHFRSVTINGVTHRIEIAEEQDWDDGEPVWNRWPEDPEGGQMITLRNGDMISIQDLQGFNMYSVVDRDDVRTLHRWMASGMYFAEDGDELFYARSPAMAREMVRLGADINQSSHDFQNVLFFQVSSRRGLRQKSGDINYPVVYPLVSPVMIRTFVELGADLYATQRGRTLLESAVEFRDVIEELMGRDA